MPIINVNGAKINYSQLAYKGEGEAEDLVMVHGLAANMAFWLGDYAKHFSKKFRVTLFDLRGHGRSEISKNGYTPANLSADLKGLMDALGLEKANILAHSFGGVVALNFACSNPDRVSSLVLADTQVNVGRAMVKTSGWASAKALKDVLEQCGINIDTKHPYFGYHLMTEVAKLRLSDEGVPEILEPWVKRMFEGNSNRTPQNWLELMENTAALAELTSNDNITANNLYKINCPVLAVYGEKSHSMATANYLSSLWSDNKFVSIADAGHFFPKVYPQMFGRLCDAFWENKGFDEVVSSYECLKYISDESVEFYRTA